MLRERKEMRPLGSIQPKGPAQALDEIGRDLNVAPLLEPSVPGESDTGELCDLLAAKAGRAPPYSGGKPGILRLRAGTEIGDESR